MGAVGFELAVGAKAAQFLAGGLGGGEMPRAEGAATTKIEDGGQANGQQQGGAAAETGEEG